MKHQRFSKGEFVEFRYTKLSMEFVLRGFGDWMSLFNEKRERLNFFNAYSIKTIVILENRAVKIYKNRAKHVLYKILVVFNSGKMSVGYTDSCKLKRAKPA
jgi:hypothetical protein